jgi:hypothetical protein
MADLALAHFAERVTRIYLENNVNYFSTSIIFLAKKNLQMCMLLQVSHMGHVLGCWVEKHGSQAPLEIID